MMKNLTEEEIIGAFFIFLIGIIVAFPLFLIGLGLYTFLNIIF